MEKIINYCGNCPFAVTIGGSYICNLARFQKKEFFYLEHHKLEAPDWCALRNDAYLFKLRDFSQQRIEEINLVNSKIEELAKNHEDNSKELTTLHNLLDELTTNENVKEDYQQIDLNAEIDEIKNHLSALQSAGEKLKDTFMKLGEYE